MGLFGLTRKKAPVIINEYYTTYNTQAVCLPLLLSRFMARLAYFTRLRLQLWLRLRQQADPAFLLAAAATLHSERNSR